MSTDYGLQEERRAGRAPAYMVWLCGVCDSHTEEQTNGDHLCETCGTLFDAHGAYIDEEDED